jgi:sugar/nucleoside kinase (ribokinase family)
MSEVSRVYDGPSGAQGRAPDVVVVGAASRDLAPAEPLGWRMGGTATYCSLALARLGLRVGCVLGVDREAFAGPELEAVRSAGVRLVPALLEHGPVFENIEHEGRRRQRWLSKSDFVPVGALPSEWRAARAWLLGPVAGEVGEEWASVAPAGALVAVGWQGLLREFRDDGWVWPVAPTPSALLMAAGLVLASRDDLAGGFEVGDLRRLAPRAAIVLTAGDRGGIAFSGTATRRYEAAPADVVDATGAGDTFLAALIAAWLLTGELATSRALRFAAAAASCAVEGVGLAGVPTRAQVVARLLSAATP